jgi:hypothetical protein
MPAQALPATNGVGGLTTIPTSMAIIAAMAVKNARC